MLGLSVMLEIFRISNKNVLEYMYDVCQNTRIGVWKEKSNYDAANQK